MVGWMLDLIAQDRLLTAAVTSICKAVNEFDPGIGSGYANPASPSIF
jgi:hypothetical protein